MLTFMQVPAVLYVLYNRLMFLVLGVYFKPAVYRLLTQQQIGVYPCARVRSFIGSAGV